VSEELKHALECECCSKSVDVLHDFLAVADALVAKALKLSEVAQIAKTEQRMRELLLGRWRLRSDQAATAAGRIIARGGTIKAAVSRVDSIMAKWSSDVELRYGSDLEDIYFLARVAGWKKATGQTKQSLGYDIPNFTEELGDDASVKKASAGVTPTYDLFDKAAVEALHDDQMLWIGNHYDRNVRDAIRTGTTPAIIAGQGRIEAGRTMEAHLRRELGKVHVPDGFRGSDAKYMEGLAANAATVARVRGQIRSFQDAGITRYEIVNPNDRRTSPICRHMSGKVFTVEHAARQIESEAGATNPDDIRKAHPWLSATELMRVSSAAGHISGPAGIKDSKSLADAGQALPPYHFRCRSTVDVSTSAGSWKPLSPREAIPPVPPRPPPVAGPKKRPTAKPKPASVATRAATMPPPTLGAPTADATAAEMLASKATKSEAIKEGIMDARLVELTTPKGQSMKAVWKSPGEAGWNSLGIAPNTMHTREVAFYEMDLLLGGETLVPTTVVGDLGGGLGMGSFQKYVSDATHAAQLGKKAEALMADVNIADLRKTFLMDVIAANGDRHGYNLLFKRVKGDVKVFAIDHGFAFPAEAPRSFVFPTRGSWSSALTLDSASVESLEALDMDKLVGVMKKAGASHKARTATLVRISALKKDPAIITKVEPASTSFKFSEFTPPERRVMAFVERSLDSPGSLVSKGELKTLTEMAK